MFPIKFFITLLLAAAFVPGARAAQFSSSDSGEYVILGAEYGTARNHVDVTNRLKELARQDRTFRMDNSTFGVDPDPGQAKTLRIFARGPNAQDRMFEYREHSTVDGSQFRSWGNGDWGRGGWNGGWDGGSNNGDSGQYVILSAQYGNASNHVDVTNRLKELARQDRTFRLSNNTFGGNPYRGQENTLRIFALGPDGRERMFEYRENSTVDGSQFRSWGNGDWGHGGWSGNWDGGGGNNGDSGQYVILSAQYGTASNHVDVTNRLKELARQDRTFRLSNNIFGANPQWGPASALRIFALGTDGRERMFEYRVNSTVDGSQFRSWSNGDWGRGGWSGNWDGGGREKQGEMTAALQNLHEAQTNLEAATHDKGGHRTEALRLVIQAISEVEAGIRFDNTH